MMIVTDKSPNNGDATIRRLQKLAYALAFVVAVMIVHSAIMQIQLTNRNSTLDTIQEDSADINAFVDELRAEREDSTLDLQPVFRAVFDIRELLCVEYPDNEVCAES
jgi:hypothetical protein